MNAPKYEQVAADLREQMRDGRLPAGAMLPTVEQLIAHYKVSYGTVRTALIILKSEGLIKGQQGDRMYVLPRTSPEEPNS